MAVVTKQRKLTRIGINSTATARTGSPSSWKYVPVAVGGNDLGGSVGSEEVELERSDPGLTHLLPTTRNADKGKLDLVVYPENAGLLLKLAVTLSASNLPEYFTAEEYNTTSPGPGFDAGDSTGRACSGCLADGFSFSFDRKSLGVLRLSIDAFINADRDLESAVPTPTWPTQNPYVGKKCVVDVDFGDNSGSYSGWSGDQVDLRSLSVSYQNGIELDLHRANESDYDLDGSWTQAYLGTPRAQVSFKLIQNSGKYTDLHRLEAALRKVRFRIAAKGSNPSGVETSASNVTAGSTKTLLVASTTGFAVGDVCLLRQETANKFNVATITTVNADTSLVFDSLDVAMDGSGAEVITITNTAWQVKITDAVIKTASRPKLEGNVYVIDVTADAIVGPSNTAPLTVIAYNDDNT